MSMARAKESNIFDVFLNIVKMTEKISFVRERLSVEGIQA
jgi:hypothetical protein